MQIEDYLPYDDGFDEGSVFDPYFFDENRLDDPDFDHFGEDEEMSEEDEFYAWWK